MLLENNNRFQLPAGTNVIAMMGVLVVILPDEGTAVYEGERECEGNAKFLEIYH